MRGRYAIALLLALGLLPAACGQVHGAPASVTSTGGSRGMTPGVPASVTSLGPRGWSAPRWSTPGWVGLHRGPVARVGMEPSRRGFDHDRDDSRFHHRRHFFPGSVYPYSYYYPYGGFYYDDSDAAMSYADQQAAQAEAAQAAQDDARRERQLQQQIDDLRAYNELRDRELQQQAAQAPPPAAPPEPAITLVFKDGHRAEVQNYAIMGDTLYDLSGGRTRKIPLADLDLAATNKVNDENGVEFHLPKRNPA